MNEKLMGVFAPITTPFTADGTVDYSGLEHNVRAYAKSVSNALQEAVIVEKRWMKRYQLHFDYALIGRMDHYFREQQLTVLDKQYAEDVCYTYLCDHDNSEDIRSLTNGRYLPAFDTDVMTEVTIEP